MTALEISTAGTNEMTLFRDWSMGEGWNPGDLDIVTFHAADPLGFFFGKLDGRPVAAISAVRYGTTFGFLGQHVTQESVRGQGFGTQLWRRGMDHLAGRTIGLDAVVEQQDNYRKAGFRQVWRNIRYEGVVAADDVPGITLIEGRTIPFGQIADFDRRFFPAPREANLAVLMTLPRQLSVGAVRDGELVGFGVVRPSQVGHRVGPLHASTPEVARAVLTKLAALVSRSTLFLDVPDVNAEAIKLAEQLGLEPTSERARMYAGPVPELDLAGIYAPASVELG
jgi:hypothetical protein